MKQSKISRRSFLLGLGAVSAAAVLTACGGSLWEKKQIKSAS